MCTPIAGAFGVTTHDYARNRNLQGQSTPSEQTCLVARGDGALMGTTNSSWGAATVQALSRTVLAVTVELSPGHSFQVVRRMSQYHVKHDYEHEHYLPTYVTLYPW